MQDRARWPGSVSFVGPDRGEDSRIRSEDLPTPKRKRIIAPTRKTVARKGPIMRRRFILLAGALALVVVGAVAAYLLVGSSDGGRAQTEIDKINEQYVRKGVPTLRPDYDLHPPSPAPHPPATPTPGPSPTPVIPVCAEGTITGAEEIVAKHGNAVGPGCAGTGTQLYFLAEGTDTEPGGFAVFVCDAEDSDCSPLRPLKKGGAWSFFPAPFKGRLKVLIFTPPGMFLVHNPNAMFCFDLRTHQYDQKPFCAPEPTVPSEIPTPIPNVTMVIPTEIVTPASP
jgi:hypothetical protein